MDIRRPFPDSDVVVVREMLNRRLTRAVFRAIVTELHSVVFYLPVAPARQSVRPSSSPSVREALTRQAWFTREG